MNGQVNIQTELEYALNVKAPILTEKRCSKCKEIKPISEFYKDNRLKRHRAKCKECIKSADRHYRLTNPKKVKERHLKYYLSNSEKINEYVRQWRLNNPEKAKKTCRQWILANHEKIKEQCRQRYLTNHEKEKEKAKRWRLANPEKTKEIIRLSNKKILSTPKGRLNNSVSSAIGQSLRGNKNGGHWEDLVGYTLEHLKKHLEKQFDEHMSWDNYGSYWWIDHIVPISKHHFETAKDLDFQRCWNLKNLRPLEKIANIIKKDKLTKPFQPAFKTWQGII